ncbi:DNA/RNA non-specific endonuclease [Enterococcus sp. DIV1298c]|uniref:DNA-entry nuclease n=1 Tax=Candidatus Enterococcus mangumiae TaxID=2230878 RepID=A0ABZ2T0B2_9ENTE|nr:MULTISPECIES: DNA/RNA non-specific endonuclease [unclassified Enterococcus]MBO0460387.1 DNA/RNA non-specific endonuclease [Enterococcus sp. DIV1298c]MBO0490775.1 DNA/RNA non-specific endonuclease [Enterococcus sp. DIV1094]
MKNLKKLWGTLISLVVLGAIGFIGMDLVNEEPTVTTDYSESASLNKESGESVTEKENATQNSSEQRNNGLPQEEDLAPTGNNPGPQDLGQASFTANDFSTNHGWIEYHALDQLGRPTGADALLEKSMINTGTSANRDIRPPGFISGPRYDHSRGHLIAKQFGGSGDDKRNLVTLFQFPVNDPYMNFYELKIRKALNHGETVRYRVTPHYAGDELIPESVELEAKGTGNNPTIDFTVLIPNKK